MTCIKCGENVPDTANFCPRCGAVVSKEGRKSKTKFNVGWITIAAGFSQWCGNVSKSILTGDDMATWVGWTVLAIALIVGIALIASSRSIRLQSTTTAATNAPNENIQKQDEVTEKTDEIDSQDKISNTTIVLIVGIAAFVSLVALIAAFIP